MRILNGQSSWWCLHDTKIAELPRAAVAVDEDGAPALTEQARSELTQAGFFRETPRLVYGLTVLTTTACNLGCAYCFQNVGTVDEDDPAPDRIPVRHLTPAGVGEILSFTGRMMERAGLSKLKVLLFGGEPLMNFPGCRLLLDKARDHGLVAAAMVSNGTLLTPHMVSELADLGLGLVQITFDGDRDSHDRIRVTRAGRGTFDRIVSHVAAAAKAADLHWQFRINVSHRNQASVVALLEHLADHIDASRLTVNFALVDDVGIGYDNRFDYSDDAADEYLSWHLRALDLGFALQPPKAAFYCDFCSTRGGALGAVANADGTLFSCWETVGAPNLEVGHVRDGYIPPDQLDSRWFSCQDRSVATVDPVRRKRFQDRVDAGLLDALSQRTALPSG